MQRSESINELATALAVAQGAIANAPKDAKGQSGNKVYRYATLASIWDACRQALTANGLSVSQDNVVEPGGVKTTTLLMHSSGQWLSNELVMPLEDRSQKGIGMAITYARRYALGAMVGVAPEDESPEQARQRQSEITRRLIADALTVSSSLGEEPLARSAYLQRTFGVASDAELSEGQASDWLGHLRKRQAEASARGATDGGVTTNVPSAATAASSPPRQTLEEALAEQEKAEALRKHALANGEAELLRRLTAVKDSYFALAIPWTPGGPDVEPQREQAWAKILQRRGLRPLDPPTPEIMRELTATLEGHVQRMVEEARLRGVSCAAPHS